MLNKLKGIFTPHEILSGNFGIEREGLRVLENGELALTKHPNIFEKKICNPYITTDFSESQIEVITPTFSTSRGVYNFCNSLYDIVAMEIGDELLWPQSMPSIIPDDDKIPVAEFCECPMGVNARKYREILLKKYGGKKQLISGIHYNFSLTDEVIDKLYENSDKSYSFKYYKNSLYLKIVRNYIRYKWLIIYLLGATPTVHKTFLNDTNEGEFIEINKECFSNEGTLSFRNGDMGYRNNVELYPNYDSVEDYVDSINKLIDNKLIESHKELYSQVRLKAKNPDDFLNSLLEGGINYLEYRSIDINPFERGGISLQDLEFLQIFNLFLLICDETDYTLWQQDAEKNQRLIAKNGLNNINLFKDGVLVSKETWGLEILEKIKEINKTLSLGKEEVIEIMENRITDSSSTYSYKILKRIKEDGYINTYINLAKKYKEEAYNNRFKLVGFEDLELSTQILMKEAIKRGIKTDVVDRADNFISLRKCEKIEYVKQATKTSKDNYISVLMMENKTVTKNVLERNNINVPKGLEFDSIDNAKLYVKDYINKPIVIKPKSTNFGTGISIFKEGASEEDIIKAFEIAFTHDNTVLIEEFIKGKEYRFLVIDDKVVGILHRVPANVTGDGKQNIRELVNMKNKDSLRGYHYRTPLEKINLDDHCLLFLKQQGIDFDYIPLKNEVIYLRENSNISTGGDSIDFTDDIPERFKNIAVEATKAIGAKICGVDMMIEDYSDENSNYSIIELNFNPAIHIHSFPYKGVERKIAVEILKLLDLVNEEK